MCDLWWVERLDELVKTFLHIEQGNNPFLPVAVWKVSAGFSFSVLIGVPSSGSRMTSFMSPVSGFRTRVGLMNCFIGRPASWSRMCRFLELGSRNLLLHTVHSWGCSPVKNNQDLKVAFRETKIKSLCTKKVCLFSLKMLKSHRNYWNQSRTLPIVLSPKWRNLC